jgi:hypothetical protein
LQRADLRDTRDADHQREPVPQQFIALNQRQGLAPQSRHAPLE